ncbi:ribokinase [Halalkalibacillus halophilus]|uniref:ribokinase n=1 Tax=Halalkalibacillus halophilus TaxID=392827 RepID=UPI000415C1D8|nr:ribokinase [Halalkalibacillus halophilus]
MPVKITVIGSINMDLVTSANRFPSKGETIMGEDFKTIPGGKGANQAIAASKLGAEVTMIGCVGEDAFAKELIENFEANGIDTTSIQKVQEQPTGIASITIAESDNHIIVVPGANHAVQPKMIEEYKDIIIKSDLLLLQHEIPLNTVAFIVDLAYKNGTDVVLNPAPAHSIPLEVLEKVKYLTPNEHELSEILDDEEKTSFYRNNREKFIVTQGGKGVEYYQDGQEQHVPGFDVDVVDTTGAGDSFNGGFSVALAQGKSLETCCYYGNAVGALSVSKLGAQTGMPTHSEVEAFLASYRSL